MNVETSKPEFGLSPSLTVAEEPTFKPVILWSAFGAVVLAVHAYTYYGWLTSGTLYPTPTGPDPIPASVKFWIDFWQVVGVSGVFWAVYQFIYKPLRQTGRMSTDGMLVICFFQLYLLQDPFANYTVPIFQYNAGFINFGSWCSYVPGWISQRGSLLPEPILFTGGLYIWLFCAGLIAMNYLMRKAKQRWPQMGPITLVAGTMVFAGIVDFAFEGTWLQQGLYSYGGHIRKLSIFAGTAAAYPIYEGILWGITWGFYAALRYYKNGAGLTFAERGVNELNISTTAKQWVRFLALIGVINFGMLVFYNIPYQWFAVHADPIPDDVLDKSYLTAGMFGKGTDYAAPGPQTPIAITPQAAHLDPEGNLVEPIPTVCQIQGCKGFGTNEGYNSGNYTNQSLFAPNIAKDEYLFLGKDGYTARTRKP